MRSSVSVPISMLFAATIASSLGGCAALVMQAPEAPVLKCGDTKLTQYLIPTTQKPVPVDVHFTMACFGDRKGVEISLQNHPWGGVGKTMPMSIGKEAPHYEYIPCANNDELKEKWKDMENYEDFANKGREITDIKNVQIDSRFQNDYRLRRYMLQSAKNICAASPQ